MSSAWPAPSSTKLARLTPSNNAAKEAFDRIASYSTGVAKDGKRWNPHAVKHIVVDQWEEETYIGDNDNNDNDLRRTECVRQKVTLAAKEKRQTWTGYYQLDFDSAPRLPDWGWTIGSWDPGDPRASADIVLTDRMDDAISTQHARLFHNFDSGAFVLGVRKATKVVVDATEEMRGLWVIHKQKTSIEIEGFQYFLEVEAIREQDYRTFLDAYQKDNGLKVVSYPRTLVATRSDLDQSSSDYVMKNLVAQGGTCAVYAGYGRRDGRAVAIKKFKRNYSNAAHVDRDKEVARKTGPNPHPQICRLVDVIESDPDDPNKGYRTLGLDEVHMIYRPLASWTLEKLLNEQKHIEYGTSLGLFHEFLDGIEFLHSKGLMHRDMKPANLTVLTLVPSRGQLIDFGHADGIP